MLFKREDLYAPFGTGEVNGGKLRQCMLLVNKIHRDYEGLVTCCSIHSPQAPITAATAKAFGMQCQIPVSYTHLDVYKRQIYSVLRYTRSWHENPRGGITVNYDEPLNFAGGPMPKCKVATKEEEA